VGRWLSRADTAEQSRAAAQANHLLLRPAVYSVLLLLFMMFDDRDMQFIYFQF
jgi:hypothetical protein